MLRLFFGELTKTREVEGGNPAFFVWSDGRSVNRGKKGKGLRIGLGEVLPMGSIHTKRHLVGQWRGVARRRSTDEPEIQVWYQRQSKRDVQSKPRAVITSLVTKSARGGVDRFSLASL